MNDDQRMPALPQITDEDLIRSAPSVRALLVGRLEALYRPVQNALAVADDPALPVDPRLLEIGIRIVDKLSTLYGISRPRPAVPDEEPDEGLDPAVDRRALIEEKLVEIERRAREQEAR